MSQDQIIELLIKKEKILIKELKNIVSEEKRMKIIWDQALSTEDIAYMIGVGVVNTSRAIGRLIITKELKEIRTQKDRRKLKYVTKKVIL